MINHPVAPLAGFAIAESGQNLLGDVTKRDNAFEHSHLRTRAGHAIDRAGRFILADRESALSKDGLHSESAVTAHASHDDTHGVRAKDLGDGEQHHVDRWNVDDVVGVRRDLQNHLGGSAAANGEVLSCGSQVDMASSEHHTIFRFVHVHVAEIVEALGERAGESDRHVLHNEDTDGQVGGQIGEDLLQSFRTASRRSHGNDRWGAETDRGNGRTGRTNGWPGPTASISAGAGRCFDLADKFVLDFDDVKGTAAETLGEAVEGSQFQRFESGLRSFLSHGTDHDDGPGGIVHDPLEDFEAAETGHVDIEGDDVGLEPVNLRESLGAGLGSADDTQRVVGLNHAREGNSHEGAVIGDQHFDRRSGSWGGHDRR